MSFKNSFVRRDGINACKELKSLERIALAVTRKTRIVWSYSPVMIRYGFWIVNLTWISTKQKIEKKNKDMISLISNSDFISII